MKQKNNLKKPIKKKFSVKQYFLTALALSSSVSLNGCSNPTSTSITDANNSTTKDAFTPAIEQNQEASAYNSIQDFSYDLFAQTMNTTNPVLSPVSAYLTLSMASLGADGDTKAEFVTLLGDDYIDWIVYITNFFSLDSKNTKLSLANSAWMDDLFTVEKDWQRDIDDLLDAETFVADLSTTETMDNMNGWVKSHTNGLIDHMIEEPFPPSASLVLFNTIYFKAKWDSPFESSKTYADTFTPTTSEDKTPFKTNMMHKSHFYADYLANDFVEGLIFPYLNQKKTDGNLAFIALKPRQDNTNIRDLYDQVTSDVIEDLLNNKQNKLINTKLPKFTISFNQVLNNSLQNMGLLTAFDIDSANFSRLGQTENEHNLYISLIRQKAKIIVDEEGTEAAATTELELRDGGALLETAMDVYFDQPFLYIILDMDQNIPIFIGILDQPDSI